MCSVTAVSSPPITPAIAMTLASSQIANVDSFKSTSFPSNNLRDSPALARLTEMPPESLSASNACIGCPISSITKLVISTTRSILLTPLRLNFSVIWIGVGLVASMPFTNRPRYLGHSSGASIFIPRALFGSTFSTTSTFGTENSKPFTAAISLAIPLIDKQSPLLGVRSKSIVKSSTERASDRICLRSLPTSNSFPRNSIRPLLSSPKPSS